ncbi:MAG: hypothetical protein B6D61_08500 [Bacteroidetes bacterium 4484_249]|nr:MAG: hypothetical protein B6D61_08500 [Bacteroidetes bacterium 4484_249]
MRYNPEASKYLSDANTNQVFSSVLLGATVILAGSSIYTYVVTRQPFYLVAIAAIGGIYAIVSIPLNNGFKKNIRLAIKAYNNGLKKFTYNDVKLKFGVTNNGIGFVMNF